MSTFSSHKMGGEVNLLCSIMRDKILHVKCLVWCLVANKY